jgi:hypothetical protein
MDVDEEMHLPARHEAHFSSNHGVAYATRQTETGQAQTIGQPRLVDSKIHMHRGRATQMKIYAHQRVKAHRHIQE